MATSKVVTKEHGVRFRKFGRSRIAAHLGIKGNFTYYCAFHNALLHQ